MKGGQQAIDLFLGDDSNYVKLPSTGGVEIATQNFNQYSWIFSTDGNLTIPGDIRSEGNINIDINLSDSTLHRWQFGEDGELTFPNGGQISNYPGGVGVSNDSWFVTPDNGTGGISSQDGQQYIQINDNLHVEIGTSYGTENESIWQFGLDGNLTLPVGGDILDSTGTSVLGVGGTGDSLTSNNDINITVNSEDSSSYTWNFGQTGDLTAPGDIVVGGVDGGHIYIDSTEGANTSVRWINMPVNEDASIIRAYTGNPDEETGLNRGRIQLAWQDSDRSGLRIISYDRTDSEDTVEHEWTFQGDGGLQFPDGTTQTTAYTGGGGNANTGDFTFSEDTITNGDGLILSTNRGTLAMGTDMEVPGVAQHFHIAFDGSNSNPPASDLFLGDDHNYVKLPGYELNPTAQFGVEIGTDNRNLGPQNIEVGTVDELVPPGGVWRVFIDHETYPNLGSAVSVGDTVTTSWGTPITATITDVVEEPGNWWKIHVAQDITAGFLDEGETVSFGASGDSHVWRFGTDGDLTIPGDIKSENDINITVNSEDSSSYTWNFGQTGILTAPDDIVTGTNGGRFVQDCADGTTSMRWINVEVDEDSTQLIRAYSGEGDSDERAQIKLNWQDEDRSGLTIRSFDRTDTEDTVSHDWKFQGDGSIEFPDGSIQTTAYTGQNSGAIGTFFVVVNEDGTVSKSTDGVTWTTAVDLVQGIGRVATNGVTVAMIQSDQLSWTTFAGLEASTYVSGSSGTADEIGGQDIDWNQIDYAGGYFVAVGSYTPTGSSFTQGVYGYSTDGRIWAFLTVDQTVVEFFGNDPVDSDWEFSDVDYNGVGWMFSVGDNESGDANGGGVYITDLTATVTSARCFSMNITYRAAWNGSAWYMEGEDSIAGVNTNLDPRNGTFAGPIDPWATDIQDLGIDAGDTVETAGGNGYLAAGDGDGHVAWSDDNGQTWQIVTPIPYTRTISAITQASPPQVTFSGSGNNGTSGEKVVISGSSVSGYNGTFYWKSADNSLYTDQILDTPFDTSGLAPFTGTATLTWSNGTYIDAMDYINGYFYIGNDDEQIARTTDFVSWTILDDQSSSEFDYWNDIAGFVGTGGDIGDIVVEVEEGTTTLTLANKDFTLETTRTGTQDADINLTAADDIWIEANGNDISLSAADQVRINTGWSTNDDPEEYPTWTFDNVGDLTIPGNIKSEGNINLDINLSDSTLRRWTFGEDGNLNLPTGGDILDSEGNSVLGGATGDANVWVQTFETQNGAPTDIVSLAISVEYDSAGNVIALFNHFNDDGGGSSYYSVGKYTTTGAKIWTARFDDEFYTDGWGLAVDNDSNSIYVAGETDVEGQDNATLTKIDSTDGSVLWSKIYDFGFSSQSSVVDVASDGDPVMVGYAYNGTDDYVATTKVDAADGSVIWSRALDGQADEEAYGMAVGPTGEVVAIGYMEQLGILDAAETLYADPVSNANWTINQTGVLAGALGFDVSFAAGVPTFANISDTAGGRTVDDTVATILGSILGGADGVDDMVVKVATLAANNTDNHMLVVKYNSAGSIQWQKAILFDEGFDCRGADADIDSAGNIYVTGSYEYSFESYTTSALSILKLDGTGAKQWSRRVTGDCDTFGVSVVVGADDKLYLSAMTGNDANSEYTWVAAKYGIDGTVEWQRLIDNTTGWSFAGNIFGADGGGSNIAVKDGYVLLGGGFGNLPEDFPQATVVQVSAAGDVFTVGDWDFKAASFSGVLSADASDITVVNAGKTDTDNAENITTGTVTLTTEVSGFLIGTLYSTTANNRLINGSNELVLGTTGTVTLPQGGTITEGYVTSNPTIQLTPATPTVASQKLVIKGGSNYNFTDNGITLSYQDNTANNGDSLDFYINNAITYANQTLYWWIYPEGAGLTTPSSGTIALNGSGNSGEESISFVVDSDAYEFTVRVSPEEDNYDPANVGVESGLINGDAPAYGDHHLHLTTGDLTETSIFLGTDDHNVRTTTDGKIQITTPNDTNNVWEFDATGNLTIPGNIRSEGNIDIEINLSDSTLRRWSFGEDGNLTLPNGMTIDSEGSLGSNAFVRIGGNNTRISIDDNGAPPGIVMATDITGTGNYWLFSSDGITSLPGDLELNSTGNIRSENAINIEVNLSDSTLRRWRFGEDGELTFPDNTVQTTAYTGNTTATTPTTTGIPNGFALDAYTNTNLTPGNYSNILVGFDGKNVTLGVQVSSEYNITIFGITNASPATFIISDSAVIPGNLIGGATPTDDLTITVDSLDLVAIDLTKTINKLTDGEYTLADGVEGQIMYLVRQDGSTAANISVVVANARWDGGLFPDQLVVPFQIPFTDMVTIIFTDGAWQASTFGSLT
jgi:hypothetical protein